MKNQTVKKVIDPKNLPMRFSPISWALLFYLMKDHHAPDWAFGVYWTLCFLVNIVILIEMITREKVDIFNGDNLSH